MGNLAEELVQLRQVLAQVLQKELLISEKAPHQWYDLIRLLNFTAYNMVIVWPSMWGRLVKMKWCSFLFLFCIFLFCIFYFCILFLQGL